MKKIYVIIPTLNEEKTISSVTSIIDEGLVKYFKNIEKFIVNSDSRSSDRTVELFNKENTETTKISLICEEQKTGKGWGLYNGFTRAIHDKADFISTFDGDLRSIDLLFVKKLINPLVTGKASFVAPVYTRNRFEGNTTNHFSSPIMYACFGYDLLQPIAGDFALSQKLAKEVLKNFKVYSDYAYGVDSIISFTALLNDFTIKQQTLSSKIHNPSFSKIIPIFKGEALSTFYFLNSNRAKIIKKIKQGKTEPLKKGKVIDSAFIRKPEEKSLKDIFSFATRDIKKYNYEELKINGLRGMREKKNISGFEWSQILADYILSVLKNKHSLQTLVYLAESLLPLYLLRVLTYFKEIENKSIRETEEILKMQKKQICGIIRGNISA